MCRPKLPASSRTSCASMREGCCGARGVHPTLLESTREFPGVGQGDVPVGTRRRNGSIADHSRLDLEEAGSLEAVLDMSVGFQQGVDPIATGEERHLLERAF